VSHRPTLIVISLALVMMSCAPRPAEQNSGRPDGQASPGQTAFVDRPLNIAVTNEPTPLAGKFFGTRSGQKEYPPLFAAPLIRLDYRDTPTPILATEVPSLDRGTWKVLDGGQMETTYRLRSSATWHDGAPFTADDVVFTWRTIMNPDVVVGDRTPERFIDAIDVLDPYTMVIHWKEPYIYANSYDLLPMPRHILEPLLARSPDAFERSPYWTTEWIGLGPYTLAEWVPGSYLKGQAFASYVLGVPKISEVFVHFISDTNQAVARVLGGAIDLTSGSTIKFEEGAVLKGELESRGMGTVVPVEGVGGMRLADFQFREPVGPPGRDVRVRQAMVHALDRQVVTETIHHGFTEVAHMYIARTNPAYETADRAIRKYPYDPRRAQELLAAAGWTRGGDGMLVNASGERFDLGVQVTEGAQTVRESQVYMDHWRQVGINSEIEILTRANQNDAELRSRFPGVAMSNANGTPASMQRWAIPQIATAANRWVGNNRGAYVNEEATRLAADYYTILDLQKRIEAHSRFLSIIAEELPSMPLYTLADVSSVAAGLRAVVPAAPGEGWLVENAHVWYWER
jgi:peptide/nickel transport system substrate-binding protein